MKIQNKDIGKYIVVRVRKCHKQYVPGYGVMSVTISNYGYIYAIFVIEKLQGDIVTLKPTKEFESCTPYKSWDIKKMNELLTDKVAFMTNNYDNASKKLNDLKYEHF